MIRTSTPRIAASCSACISDVSGTKYGLAIHSRCLGRVDGVHEEQAACFQHVRRIGREAQRGFVFLRRGVGRPIELGHVAGRPVPVFEKCELNRLHDRAADFDHACRATVRTA